MIGGVVEVAEDGRYLRKERGFLVAMDDQQELARIPKDEIEALVLSANQTTISKNLLVSLADQGSITLLTGANYAPAAMVVPIASGVATTGHPEDQLGASKSLKKRLWQQLVQQKIKHQSLVLQLAGETTQAKHLNAMAGRVLSGDPDNLEAQAARAYFPALFGKKFKRNRNESGINAALNYGYAILRSACARGLYATGLHPAIGIHHQSRRNPLCLADDLIELFRPLVDNLVFGLEEFEDLTPEVKAKLVSVLQVDMLQGEYVSPVTIAINRTAVSLARCLRDKTPKISLPHMTHQGQLF
ncbi:MAG: type II CRISPR-associated endonuclease Cas1 [Alphaproteobacteria bacterium]